MISFEPSQQQTPRRRRSQPEPTAGPRPDTTADRPGNPQIDQTQQHSAGRYATPEGCRVQGSNPSAADVCSNNEGINAMDMEYLHVSIEINGVKLEVIGNYWPGEAASWDSPGESESVEIDRRS